MSNVSVVIPTYQSGRFLSESLESVLSQTFQDFEIIVVDDGSTDNTQEIMSHYSSEKRIKYYYQPNRGPSAARNLGIKMSSGNYIAFLDADDIWLPTKLKKQITLLEENTEIALVFSDAYVFDEINVRQKTLFNFSPPSSGKVLERLFILNFIPLLTVVVRRNVLDEIGFFDESLIGPEDYDLWLRICQTKMVDFIDEPLAKYRISSGQISKRLITMMEFEIRVKERILINSPMLLTMPKADLDKGFFKLLIRIAKLLLQNNQINLSRIYLNKYLLYRGITFRYLTLRFLCILPFTIQRIVLSMWDHIREPQTR